MSTTVGDLKTLAKYHSDMVNSDFISDAEWLAYIQLGYNHLYDTLVQKYGDDYFTIAYQFTTDGATDYYPLPDGSSTYKLPDGITTAPAFYKLLGVDVQVIGGTSVTPVWVTVRPFTFVDRNRYVIPNYQVTLGANNMRYRLRANNIWLTPRQQAGQLVQLHYVPRCVTLTSDSDVIDGVSGWEELIAVEAAIRAKQKEESDTSVLERMKAEIIERIEEAAENRDVGAPPTTGDTLFRSYLGAYGGIGPGLGGPGW